MNIAQRLLMAPIRFYKKFISPSLADHCRFVPTCSTYAMEAIRVHGAFWGFLLAAWRVLRCCPLGGQGFDPVPPKGERRFPHYRQGREGRP